MTASLAAIWLARVRLRLPPELTQTVKTLLTVGEKSSPGKRLYCTGAWLAKRRRAILESNPPMNSRLRDKIPRGHGS
jgi:hypothetical protein